MIEKEVLFYSYIVKFAVLNITISKIATAPTGNV